MGAFKIIIVRQQDDQQFQSFTAEFVGVIKYLLSSATSCGMIEILEPVSAMNFTLPTVWVVQSLVA